MSNDKKKPHEGKSEESRPETKKINRRDFVATSVGGAIGIGMFGLLPKLALQDGDITLPSRNPAAALNRDAWKLASPISEIADHYDVLVIGSGYGGSILAARLAGPNRSLALFERGREWLPGDFPTDNAKLMMSQRSPVNPGGLLDWHAPLSSDMDIVCASGVGGTSLINAAIATRPEDIVFEQHEWPAEIREAASSGKLKTYFDRAEEMLQPNTAPNVEDMAKVEAHHSALTQMGIPYGQLRLNINHAAGANRHNSQGVPQSPCTSCGDCCSGCNVGAKNTLQTNYLPLAKKKGAKIFSEVEVDWIEKTEGGYQIHYRAWSDGIQGVMPRTVSAKTLILSAGSLGSTEILLTSQKKGNLKLSDNLGSRFSTNGDVLGFSYNGTKLTNIAGFGAGNARNRSNSLCGQAIMVYGDYRKHNASSSDIQNRFLLLDGTVPQSTSNMMAKAFAAWAMAHKEQFSEEQMARVKLDLEDPLTCHKNGALNHSMVYLACGHDSSGGRFEYHFGERPRIIWPKVSEETFSTVINSTMAEHTKLQGGVYLENPRSTIFGGKRLIATHPLGGCPMGTNVSTGVVDHSGRVFDPDASDPKGVHEGLYIADGSIIPRSLAATPLMTISALSERIAEILLEKLS